MRFLSCEPLLGPVDLTHVRVPSAPSPPFHGNALHEYRGFRHRIDWVIVGGESGTGARPMHEDWVRGLRDQCAAAAVPFFYKQRVDGGLKISLPTLDGVRHAAFPEGR